MELNHQTLASEEAKNYLRERGFSSDGLVFLSNAEVVALLSNVAELGEAHGA